MADLAFLGHYIDWTRSYGPSMTYIENFDYIQRMNNISSFHCCIRSDIFSHLPDVNEATYNPRGPRGDRSSMNTRY